MLRRQQILFSILLLTSSISLAGEWRFRAREHYEIHKISKAIPTTEFKGFSNTLNLWYEEPFDYAIGFAASPLLGSAKNDSSSTELGQKIQLYSAGLEFKYFLYHSLPGLFTRLGAGWSHLKSQGTLDKNSGWHGYAGLGWEHPFKYFSLVPEVAVRQSYLQNDLEVFSLTPSIAIHFHKSLL